MRLAGSRASEAEDKSDGKVTVIGPPLPAVTGIAAWDSALLEDYQRRKRAQQLAAAAAVVAAAAEAAAAAGEDESFEFLDEDFASVAEVSPSAPRGAHNGCDKVDDNTPGTKAGRTKIPGTPMMTTPKVPGAAPAAAAATTTTAATATTAVCPQVAETFREENNDGGDATSSESVDSISIFSGMTGCSDSGHEDYDSAQEQGDQDAGLDHGSELEVECRRERSVQETNGQQPAQDGLGGGGIGSPADDGPEEQHPRDSGSERAHSSDEGEKPPSKGRKPPAEPGASKSSPPHSRRRARKLSGLHGALELATRCLRKDGFNAKAYSLRAELEARLGRRDRAIADFRAAASLEVGDPRPRINMVRADADWRAKRSILAGSSPIYSSYVCLCSNGNM